MASEERPEDLTVAETIDAIFGEGSAAAEFGPEGLATARRPYEPGCRNPFEPGAGPGAYHVRLKVTPSGHVSPTHPDAPLGRHGEVWIVQINNVPPGVSVGEVCRLYAATADLSDSPMREFERLGIGRILR